MVYRNKSEKRREIKQVYLFTKPLRIHKNTIQSEEKQTDKQVLQHNKYYYYIYNIYIYELIINRNHLEQ